MNEPLPGRRQFFRGVLRNVSLALVGVAGGVVVVKRRRFLREGKCISRGVCAGCAVFEDCGLPRARSVRVARVRTHNGR